MTRHRSWSRTEKIKVAVVAALGIPILLFLWMVKEALVGHTERVTVWSCTACLKDEPAMCGVFESGDFDAALEEKEARSNAWWKLCHMLEAKDPRRSWSVCNDLDERIDVTCSSRETWQQVGGGLFRVRVH